ncbi:MAG: hypothetical protein VX955_16180, partial [Pseudomonadota bacterium]|nr:hypothetical protein [Pseudomonadota bacterium]
EKVWRREDDKNKIEAEMSQVFMDCPTTRKLVDVGLNMEWNQLEAFEPVATDPNISNCPHCGKSHRFEKQDLYLRADGGG